MDAYNRVKKHMKKAYNKDINELVIGSSKGYWVDKNKCDGTKGCKHPIHNCIGNSEGVYHTYYFAEFGRDTNGRFLRPFRAWEELKKITLYV